MSHYDWERGTLKLPWAAVAAVKAAVREAANNHHDALLAELKAWWKVNGTRSQRLYVERIQASSNLSEDGYLVLEMIAHQGTPRQVQAKDLEHYAPRATNRTTHFPLEEASIAFDGANVSWYSGDNNHQVERARRHPVARAFFAALDRVQWTRGSGGELIGNDEYNSDSDAAGGGGNYVTAEYGPNVRRPQVARW